MLKTCPSLFIRLIVSTASCRHGSLKDGLEVQDRMGASKLHLRMKRFPVTVVAQGYCASSDTISLGGDCISLIDCTYTTIFISKV